MVLLSTTPSISKAVDSYFQSSSDSSTTSALPALSLPSASDYSAAISHDDLILLAQHLSCSLAELTTGSQIYFPPKKAPPPKSKEYLELMESLKIKQQEDEYQQLIGNKNRIDSDQDYISPGMAVKELREQLSTIVNIAISVGSVAFAVWYWSGTSTHWSLPIRTLLALFAAILVLVAESVVYLGYKNKIAEAKAAEQNKHEVKQVVSSVPITTLKEKPNQKSVKSRAKSKSKRQ